VFIEKMKAKISKRWIIFREKSESMGEVLPQ
jgi:hypothetical protein